MIDFTKVNRNTQAYWIRFPGGHRVYISYETVVGYTGSCGSCRRHNDWGPTTGRHINRDLDIGHLPEVSEEEMDRRITQMFVEIGAQLGRDRFGIAA